MSKTPGKAKSQKRTSCDKKLIYVKGFLITQTERPPITEKWTDKVIPMYPTNFVVGIMKADRFAFQFTISPLPSPQARPHKTLYHPLYTQPQAINNVTIHKQQNMNNNAHVMTEILYYTRKP